MIQHHLFALNLPPKKIDNRAYEKWKHKEKSGEKDRHVYSQVSALASELGDCREQLKSTEQELQKVSDRLKRERELREETDNQLILMREKGFAYHVDRRTSAREHAKDCLNTEMLKLKHADLLAQYEALKTEATQTLEKARDRVNEERTARESLEEQMQQNRKSFEEEREKQLQKNRKIEEALEKEKAEHEKKAQESQKGFEEALKKEKEENEQKVQELEQKSKELEQKLERSESKLEAIKSNTHIAEGDLKNLKEKYEEYQQQVIDAKADSKKEQSLRAELQMELKTLEEVLDSMEVELKGTQKALKKMEELYKKELAKNQGNVKELSDLRLALAESDKERAETKEKVRMLEVEVGTIDARWLLSREHCQQEKELKQKAEDEASKLRHKMEQITVDLNFANTRREEAENQCAALRQRIEAATSEVQRAHAGEEDAEQLTSQLQQQVMTLSTELEITKENCGSLRESLERTELQFQRERELREKAEGALTLEERSIARIRREESEQEMIAMEANIALQKNQAYREIEEKWRAERKLREEAEEEVRALREEIFHLKQRNSSGDQTNLANNTQQTELEERIMALEDELVMAESRRKVTKESLENERKQRDELEQQVQAFREMIPEYAEADERYQKERRLRIEAENTIQSLRKKLHDERNWEKSPVEQPVDEGLQEQILALESELASVREQCIELQGGLDKADARLRVERQLREDAENLVKSQGRGRRATDRVEGDLQLERKLREKAEKQVMSMRLKVEAKESEIIALRSQLPNSHLSSSEEKSRTNWRSSRPNTPREQQPSPSQGLKASTPSRGQPSPSKGYRGNTPREQPSPSKAYRANTPREQPSPARSYTPQLPYRATSGSEYKMKLYEDQQKQLNEERQLRQEIMQSLPDYVKNTFGRIGFVKHSSFQYWPALVLDPFNVPIQIREKWLELYYEVRAACCVSLY
jgi:chromosome segregation ATPase